MTEIKVTKKVLATIITILILILTLATPAYAKTETLYKAKEIIAEAINTDPSKITIFEDGAESTLWENILSSDNEQYTPAKIYYYNAGSENVVIAFDVNSVSNATGEYKLNGLKGFSVNDNDETIRFYPLQSLTTTEIDIIINNLDQKVKIDEIDKVIRQYAHTTKIFYGYIDYSINDPPVEFIHAKKIVADAFDISDDDIELIKIQKDYYIKPCGSDVLYLMFTVVPIDKNTDIKELQRNGNVVVTEKYVIQFKTSNKALNESALEVVSSIDNQSDNIDEEWDILINILFIAMVLITALIIYFNCNNLERAILY